MYVSKYFSVIVILSSSNTSVLLNSSSSCVTLVSTPSSPIEKYIVRPTIPNIIIIISTNVIAANPLSLFKILTPFS